METRLTPYQASPLIECTAALVFAPHPDDEALGCGGLLCAYKAASIPVTAIFVTSGDHGKHGEAGVKVREAEARMAAEELGLGSLHFWREPDRGVTCDERTIAAAKKAILLTGADLILAPSILDIHPDHRATAWIAIEAGRRLVTEGKNLSVVMYEVGTPLARVDVLVDISLYESKKRKAIEHYTSQLALQTYDSHIFALNHFRTYTLPRTVQFAEAYCLISNEVLMNPSLIAESEIHRQERLNLVTIHMPAIYRSEEFDQLIPSDSAQQEGILLTQTSELPVFNWEDRSPLVSILCRTTNRPELVDALQSVAVQTYRNIELILVDAFGKGLSNYDPTKFSIPVHYVTLGSKLNRPQAANAAISAAQGEYLLFLDEDDWIESKHVERLLIWLLQRDFVKVAYSSTQKANKDGSLTRELFNLPFDPILLRRDNYIPIHSALFCRTLLDSGCRFDESLSVYEDWDFWLQCAQHTDFVHVPVVSAYYRMGGSSETTLRGESMKYDPTSAIFRFRSMVFDKWLPLMTGRDLNSILGTMDRSQQLLELSTEISLKNSHIESVTLQIEILSRERHSLISEKEEMRQRLESKIDALLFENQLLVSSVSWRITKPLRHVKHILKKLYNRFQT